MKRVFIGPANLANVSNGFEKSLNTVEVEADFITWSNRFHPFNYGKQKTFRIINKESFKLFDKNILFFINEYLLKPIYFLYAIVKYDIFFFITPTTFLINNYDLRIINFFRKKIVFFYAGCVDRDLEFDSDPEYVCNTCQDFVKQKASLCDKPKEKKLRANHFAKYADYIVGPPDTVSYVENKNKVHPLYLGFPDIFIKSSERDFSGKLKISHLPSNPLVKGTHIIKPVLARIAEEEDVDIIIKYGLWSREKIVDEIKSSHILIDSLAAYIFGAISIEAIQYGCVVLNAYPEWIAKSYEIPMVVKISGDTLYSTLKELIKDRDLLKQYSARSQEAFNQYFTYKVAGSYYKHLFKL